MDLRHIQSFTSSATWVITHGFGVAPDVAGYWAEGAIRIPTSEIVSEILSVDGLSTTTTFSSPKAGTAQFYLSHASYRGNPHETELVEIEPGTLADLNVILNDTNILAALGTVGVPSDTNRYVTESDPRLGLGAGGKRLYVPIVDRFNESEGCSLGDHAVNAVQKGYGQSIQIPFRVPDDFGSLVSLHVIAVPASGAALSSRNIDLSSDYGAVNEVYNQHSEANTTIVYDLSGRTNKFTALDVSSVFSAIAPGDYCGLTMTNGANIGGVIYYVGLLLQYTAA